VAPSRRPGNFRRKAWTRSEWYWRVWVGWVCASDSRLPVLLVRLAEELWVAGWKGGSFSIGVFLSNPCARVPGARRAWTRRITRYPPEWGRGPIRPGRSGREGSGAWSGIGRRNSGRGAVPAQAVHDRLVDRALAEIDDQPHLTVFGILWQRAIAPHGKGFWGARQGRFLDPGPVGALLVHGRSQECGKKHSAAAVTIRESCR